MTCTGSEFTVEMSASILSQESRDHQNGSGVALSEQKNEGRIWKLLQSQFHGTAGTRNIVIGNGLL